MEKKESLELSVLERPLEAELHVATIPGVVLGSREQVLHTGANRHGCSWPGELFVHAIQA